MVSDELREVYHINRLKEIIWRDKCFQLLFINAITGSEMKFRIVGVGKRLLFRSLQNVTLSFDLVSTHSPSRSRQHWLSKA